MLKLFRIVALALMLCSLFAFTLPMLVAQEAEPTAEVESEAVAAEYDAEAIASEGAVAEQNANVPGLSAAMLFLGAGAIVIVGLLMIARDNFTGETE